jgi:hypothetical protein
VTLAGLPQSWLRDYVSPAERAAIEREVAALAPDQLASWRFADKPVGELVRASVMWFLRKREMDLAGADGEAYRKYLIAGAEIATAAPRLLAATRPDVILETNGQFFAERILNEFAGPDTHVVAYEAGWRLDHLGFDRVSERSPVDLDEAWTRWGPAPLTAAENREIDAWMAARAGGDMQRDFYIRFEKAGRDVLSGLGLDPAKPTAALFTNLVWDTAVIGRDRGFKNIGEWLRATIAAFSQWPDRQLVIRIHPAEELRPGQETVEKLSDVVASLGPLPANVRVVGSRDPVNSYALLTACRATLVYTSTIGFEAAMRGRTVVLAAQVYYRGKGFTADVSDAADYARILDAAMRVERLDDESVALARRFAYLLLFRYLFKIPMVHHRPGRFPGWSAPDVDLLRPGASHRLDALMTSIRQGGPFV